MSARISNKAALVLIWLGTDGRVTAKQASYEVAPPNSFYFVDMRTKPVGDVPAALLSGTTSSVLCKGEHLTVELRTRPGAGYP